MLLLQAERMTVKTQTEEKALKGILQRSSCSPTVAIAELSEPGENKGKAANFLQ